MLCCLGFAGAAVESGEGTGATVKAGSSLPGGTTPYGGAFQMVGRKCGEVTSGLCYYNETSTSSSPLAMKLGRGNLRLWFSSFAWYIALSADPTSSLTSALGLVVVTTPTESDRSWSL